MKLFVILGKCYTLLSLEEAEHLRGVFHARKGCAIVPQESKEARESAIPTGAAITDTTTSASGSSSIATATATATGKQSASKTISWFKTVTKRTLELIGRHTTDEITYVALWMLRDTEMILLDQTEKNTVPPASYQSKFPQHISMANSYRFLNSDSFYSDQSISVLLRVLEENLPADRAKWWTDIRACRRRKQVPVDRSMPVQTIFNSQNEDQFMAFKSQVARIVMELHERGLLVFDAFRAFNSSNSGLMTCK